MAWPGAWQAGIRGEGHIFRLSEALAQLEDTSL